MRLQDRTALPRWILLALIHAVLLFNALYHDPRVAYDADEHLKYIEVLSGLRLPTPEETYEYFCPPLPYIAPAVARALGMSLVGAARVGLIANVLVSLFLMYHLVGIAGQLRPGDERLKLLAVGLLGTLPVYYKTFAMVRGEPMLAAMTVAVAHEAIAIFVKRDRSWRRAIALGVWLGLALLSRQQAFFILPALALLVALCLVGSRGLLRFCLSRGALAAGVAVLVSGAFYAHLAREHGSIFSYSRPLPGPLKLSNNPPSFYFDLGLDKLFTDPVRDAFPNRLIPTFHSEVWGDYWCYFLIYGRDARKGTPMSGLEVNRALAQPSPPEWLETNRRSMAAYLGRVNAMALPATGVLIAGFLAALAGLWGVRRRDEDPLGLGRALLVLLAASTLSGYFLYMTAYPSPQVGRSIKASYVLQLFPILCLLGAELVIRIGERSPRLARWLCVLLAVCAAHNIPALVTRVIAR